jgi:uncharacterized membrane protein YjjP (DUF1212 family)
MQSLNPTKPAEDSKYNISDYFNSSILKKSALTGLSSAALSKLLYSDGNLLSFGLLGGGSSLVASNIKDYIKQKLNIKNDYNLTSPIINAGSALAFSTLINGGFGNLNSNFMIGGLFFASDYLSDYILKNYF